MVATVINTPVLGFFGPYRFLSNFWPSLMLEPTLEHHFQASKATPQLYEKHLKQMVELGLTAGQAKRYGRTKIKLRPGWDDIKDETMLGLVRIKFMEAKLRQKLIATGQRELIEVNTWGDDYWGQVDVMGKLVGRNQLGIALMQVRNEIVTLITGGA